MIVFRKFFSKKEEKDKERDKVIAGGGIAGGSYILSKTKPGRLTGKVVRYHDAPTEVIDKIKREGLKSKYAEDPDNLTNAFLKDVDMDKKKGLVYTAKKKSTAFGVGTQRARVQGKFDDSPILGPIKEQLLGKSKHHKVLKLEFDYDDIKGKERIKNPELRGATNVRDFYNKLANKNGLLFRNYDDLPEFQKNAYKQTFKELGEGTHVFKGDIDPSHIVGGKGYKKRTLKQIGKYIKNNPKRFGKEAAKVAVGSALLGLGIKKAADVIKKDKEKKK